MTEALAATAPVVDGDQPLRLLVTGARGWLDRLAIQDALWDWLIDNKHTSEVPLWREPVLVVGGCPTGVDAIAERLWRSWGLPFERHVADRRHYGTHAGPRLNRQMVDSKIDFCIAFPDGASPDARACLTMARQAGVPVLVIEGHLAKLTNT